MNLFETLKQASQIVAGLIAEKTPPVFETCRKAYAELGELVSAASRMETVTPEFARGVNELIGRLEVFGASHGTIKGEEKKLTAPEFAVYFKDHIEKALEEPRAQGLRRLFALQAGINKAFGDIYEGRGDDPSVSMTVFVDPWQQASVERVGEGSPKVTSGTANREEVKGTPGLSVDDLMKSVTGKVEAARDQSLIMETGWSSDLTSKEFLRGERTWDFGRDGSKD